MELLYEKGRVRLYYIPTDRFKTEALTVSFCAPLQKETAYRNALIPMVLNRGCRPYPTSREMTERLMRLYGAGFSVDIDKRGEIQLLQFQMDFASPRFTRSAPELASEAFRYLISVLTDPVTNARGTAFQKDYFEQERLFADQFIRAEINDKQSYAARRCVQEMCAEEPFGLSEIGEPGDGDALSAEFLFDCYQKDFLRRMPVRIFYCGGQKPLTLIRILEENGIFTEDGDPMRLEGGFRRVSARKLREITEPCDVTQGKLNLGLRTNVAPDAPEMPALLVMNAVYGSGTQSKLFRIVREKHSLAYYASSRLERLKGLMTVSCGINITQKESAQELILRQLADIQAGTVTEQELNAAKASLINAYRVCGDTQFSLMDYYVGQSFLPAITEIPELIDQLAAVTTEDVVRVSQNIVPDTVYFLTAEG